MVIIVLSSILIAFAWNVFLLPHKILSSGVSGIAMIISLLTPINTGVINFALNLPLLLLGYMKLGKKFITNKAFNLQFSRLLFLQTHY